jgi:hypothetical protein
MLTGRSVTWAAKKELAPLELLTVGETPGADKTKTVAATKAPAERQPYGAAEDLEALKLVSGAIFTVSVDPTHPLGYGINGGALSLCRTNLITLKPARSAYETPAVYPASSLRSGYASEDNQKHLANSAAVVALATGKGVVIAMPDCPTFRGFWWGGDRLFFNAVFYGQTIKAIREGDGAEAAHEHAH